MVEIDYTERIRSFQMLTDNYNEEVALQYLEKVNWDDKVIILTLKLLLN